MENLKNSQNAETGEKSEALPTEDKKGLNFFSSLFSENMKHSIEAENLFEMFLNKQKMPFLFIFQNTRPQNKRKYSEELSKKNIHRPDYIIYTEKGRYYIDVKYRNKQLQSCYMPFTRTLYL
jgi:hypothetical protein